MVKERSELLLIYDALKVGYRVLLRCPERIQQIRDRIQSCDTFDTPLLRRVEPTRLEPDTRPTQER